MQKRYDELESQRKSLESEIQQMEEHMAREKEPDPALDAKLESAM